MHRGINLPIRDESGDEDKVEENIEVEEILNPEEERFFKAISKIGKRPKFYVPTFLRNLNPEELIDSTNEFEEYFEYKEIEDPNAEASWGSWISYMFARFGGVLWTYFPILGVW